jgi:hypothetical protein
VIASSGPPVFIVISTYIMTAMMDLYGLKFMSPGYFSYMWRPLETARRATKQIRIDFILKLSNIFIIFLKVSK